MSDGKKFVAPAIDYDVKRVFAEEFGVLRPEQAEQQGRSETLFYRFVSSLQGKLKGDALGTLTESQYRRLTHAWIIRSGVVEETKLLKIRFDEAGTIIDGVIKEVQAAHPDTCVQPDLSSGAIREHDCENDSHGDVESDKSAGGIDDKMADILRQALEASGVKLPPGAKIVGAIPVDGGKIGLDLAIPRAGAKKPDDKAN